MFFLTNTMNKKTTLQNYIIAIKVNISIKCKYVNAN